MLRFSWTFHSLGNCKDTKIEKKTRKARENEPAHWNKKEKEDPLQTLVVSLGTLVSPSRMFPATAIRGQAALRLPSQDPQGDDSGQWEVPELWKRKEVECSTKSNRHTKMDWFASWWKRGYCFFIGSTREILSVLCSAVVIELSFAFANQEGKKIVVDKWTDAPGNLFDSQVNQSLEPGLDANLMLPRWRPWLSQQPRPELPNKVLIQQATLSAYSDVPGSQALTRGPCSAEWTLGILRTGRIVVTYPYVQKLECWRNEQGKWWGMREGVDDIRCTMNPNFSQAVDTWKTLKWGCGWVIQPSSFYETFSLWNQCCQLGWLWQERYVFGSRCKKGSALSQTWLQKVTAWEIYNTNLLLTSKRSTISQCYFFWSAALGKKPPMIRNLSGRTWSRTTSSAPGEQNDWCKT